MTVLLARYALFSGCAGEHAGSPARQATIALAKKLGVELWEAPAQGCCGARADRPVDAVALPHLLAPLGEATSQGLSILCLAPGCRQVIAAHRRAPEPGMPAAEASTAPDTYDCVGFYTQQDVLARLVTTPARRLSRLRVAVHSTCHGGHTPAAALTGPAPQGSGAPGAADAAQRPAPGGRVATSDQTVVGLLAMTGATLLGDVSGAGSCAETYLLPDLASRQTGAPGCLAQAAQAGADVLATACFVCFAALNERQQSLARSDLARSVLVLHLSQVLGLACRVAPQHLGLGALTAPARRVLAPLFE
jgi:heterodisulfide reductase subunit B